jgi:hypothetical protein
MNGVGGCTTTDLLFTGFAAGGALAGGDSGEYFSIVSANQTLGSGPVITVLSAVRGDETGSNHTNDDGVNDWAASTPVTAINDVYSVTSATTDVTTFSFSLGGVFLGTGDITGTVYLCLGADFTGISTSSCATAGGTLQTESGIDAAAHGDNYGWSLTTPELTLGVISELTLTGGAGSGAYFTDIEEGDNTPEPSTFILLGTALAALGLLRFRAKRKAAVRIAE